MVHVLSLVIGAIGINMAEKPFIYKKMQLGFTPLIQYKVLIRLNVV